MTDHLPGDLEDRVRDAYQSAARTVQPQTLRRPSPMLAAGSVPRPRRMNAFAPIAAAMAVIVVIAASVALPRVLAGANGFSQNRAAPGISAPAPGHYPPFRVVVTTNHDNRESKLLVESAATGHAVSTLAPPWQGAMWIDVAATADARRFIVAAAPESRISLATLMADVMYRTSRSRDQISCRLLSADKIRMAYLLEDGERELEMLGQADKNAITCELVCIPLECGRTRRSQADYRSATDCGQHQLLTLRSTLSGHFGPALGRLPSSPDT